MINYSILIDCPDEYLDILNLFFIFLEKNWSTHKAHIYVTTQEGEITHPNNISFIKCGRNKNSVERSLVAAKIIKEEFILTLGCDNYPIDTVNDDYIDELIEYMKVNNAKYVQIWKMKNKEHRKYKTDFEGLYSCNKKARYSKSLMANIWDKEEFLSLFSNINKNGWAIEGMWLKECYENEPGFFENYYYCDTDPIHILHAVSKGCWIRSSYAKMRKLGITKELLSNRKKLSLGSTAKFNLSMFLFNHLSSKSFFRLKRMSGKNKSYTTNY